MLLRTGGTPESLRDAVHSLVFSDENVSDDTGDAFSALFAQRLSEQHDALTAVDTKLRERNDDAINRLLDEEQDAFAISARATGRAQREGYKDALGLVQGITGTPSGRRHFGAWFRQGWLLWNTEAPLEEVETAFYQAARLSAADPDAAVYQNLSARHLAEIQMRLSRYEDARETIEGAAALFPQDALVLYSGARAAARAGDAQAASLFVEKCLQVQPLMSTLLIGDPSLEGHKDAVGETLQRLRQAAKSRHATTTERWHKALDLVRRAESRAEAAIPLPKSLTEGGSEPGDDDDDNRAAQVLDSAEATLGQIVKNAADVELRQKRYIDKLFSDRVTWQQSLEGLKNEARAMNLNLAAPPPKKGLFGKKNQGHESVFINYHTCRQTLVTLETEIRDRLPDLKANLEEASKRHQELKATLDWLRENGSPLR
ncbi:MAG: hypothetical protein V4671_12505 [Armatimonadota bacterium]